MSLKKTNKKLTWPKSCLHNVKTFSWMFCFFFSLCIKKKIIALICPEISFAHLSVWSLTIHVFHGNNKGVSKREKSELTYFWIIKESINLPWAPPDVTELAKKCSKGSKWIHDACKSEILTSDQKAIKILRK